MSSLNLDIRTGAKERGDHTLVPARLFKFPGGEMHIDVSNIPSALDEITLFTSLRTSDDIMTMLLAVDAIRNHCGKPKIHAYIPYIPYGRQDRVATVGDPFSLMVVAELINSCKFSSVFTIDPHSAVTSREVYRLITLPILPLVKQSPVFDLTDIVLCSPDKGAVNRVKAVADQMQPMSIVVAKKERDSKSGRLNFVGFSGASPKEKNVLIIDDICDGGGTFKALAPKLLEAGAKSVHLYVTHGIFSQGLDTIYESGIMSVTTTNSIYEGGSIHNELRVLDIIGTPKMKGLSY